MKRYRAVIMTVWAATILACAQADTNACSFQLTSPAVEDGGMLPVEFTGDGAAATLTVNMSAGLFFLMLENK